MRSFLKSEKLFSLLLIALALLLSLTVTSAQSDNLALGANPTESSPGWGGGVYPWDMVDGQTYYSVWYRGLAFTGGVLNYVSPCGWRQATLNFGTMKTFNRVMIWHHGVDHIPTIFNLLYWDGSSWKNAGGTYSIRYDLAVPPPGVPGAGATPTEHIFPAVTGSKVRFELNNCNITHGWIYEFEVFYDNQSPVCTAAVPSSSSLWPAKHQLVPITVSGVTDPDGDTVTIVFTGIFQDEPVNGLGDGDKAPDGQGVGASTAAVRAERSGNGNGRVYHLNFQASDGKGGSCTGSVLVGVNHDQGAKGQAVDDGALYDSTITN